MGMAIYSSILDEKIPWTEESGGLQSIWLQRAGHDLVTKQQQRIMPGPFPVLHTSPFSVGSLNTPLAGYGDFLVQRYQCQDMHKEKYTYWPQKVLGSFFLFD